MTTLREAAQQALAFTMRDFATMRDFQAARAVVQDALRTALAQQAEPAPGWCKHCKQYSIEEPLPAQQSEPTQTPCDIAEDGVCEVIDCCRNPAQQAEPTTSRAREELLQAVAQYIGDKYSVWYGIGARDVEGVLNQSALVGLITFNFDSKVQQAEPVAAWKHAAVLEACVGSDANGRSALDALYKLAAPPHRKPLTEGEINALLPSGTMTVRDLVRSIERAHGIGGDDGQA